MTDMLHRFTPDRPPGYFRPIEGAMLLSSGEGLAAVTVPGTAGSICFEQHLEPFSHMYLVRTGLHLTVWDDRPNRPACMHSGRVESEQLYLPSGLTETLRVGQELYGLLVMNGVPLELDDVAAVRAALQRGTILKVHDSRPLQWYAPESRPPRPPRRTQKLLDGSADMTIAVAK